VLKGKVIEPVNYVEIKPGPIVLVIGASSQSYNFSCTPFDFPVELGKAATKDLSVEAIGFEDGMCFTGDYFGMYATGNGQKCTAPADFDWFEYNTDSHGR
jgi:alpha-N-arabinofuranosidase